MSAAGLWLPATRKVAIFRALNLGDLLCSIPALRAVRRALPAASIALVGLEGMRPLMRRFRHYVDEFVDFPGDPAFPEQAACVARLPEFYRYMRAQGFDLALQMHGSGIQSNAIVGKFGARQWAGFVPSLSQQTPQLMTWPDRQPEIKRYLALLEYLGLPEQDASLEFPLDDADREAAAEVARQAGIEAARTVFIHPGARLASRRWPLQRFAEAGRRLAQDGWQVVVTGCEAERPLTRSLAAAIGHGTVDLGGATGLGALASLMKQARLLICNDTGVSHIAAAVGCRSVVIASGSDTARWAPLDAGLHMVLHADMSCRPCAYDVCPVGHACALAVSPQEVVDAALAQLGKEIVHEAR